MRRIRIRAGEVEVKAVFYQTPTAEAIWKALPLEGRASRWGDEIYFEIPVEMPLEPEAKELVESGDLGYWPTGRAFCIFFGRTPISGEGEIRPASAVNVLGRVEGDPTIFKGVASGTRVSLEPA